MQYGTTPFDAYLPSPPAGTVVLFDATPKSEAEWLLHQIVANHNTIQFHGRVAEPELAQQLTHAEYNHSVILDNSPDWQSSVTTHDEYSQTELETAVETPVWVVDGLTRLLADASRSTITSRVTELARAAADSGGYVFIYAPILSTESSDRRIPQQISHQADVIADVRLRRRESSTNQEFYVSRATYAAPMRTHRRLRYEDETVTVDTTRDIS